MDNVHLMGIGGIGMSAVAELLLQKKNHVSGCDLALNSLTNKLEHSGAQIYKGHSAGHISKDLSFVVYSSAIKKDHPELLKAEEYSIPVLRRAEALNRIIKDKKIIAVTGSHGKTTTSFMITHIMKYAQMDPGFAIGGEVDDLGGNAYWSKGEYFVLEADESDGTHVCIKPYYAVITNIDYDHLEYYSDIDQITNTMEQFISEIPEEGLVIGYAGNAEINNLFSKTGVRTLNYGFNPENDIYAANIKLEEDRSKFDLWYRAKKMGEIQLSFPGEHNVLNALAAIGICLELGIDFNTVKNALSKYFGIKRRLEIVLKNEKITIIDDYAHHPNEIKAVIGAARRMAKKRLIGVFQPHRFTRTKLLREMFGKCFFGLDKLILTDIYSAGERPIEGVNGRLIYNEVMKSKNNEVIYIESKDDILNYLHPQLEKGDTVLFLGAGDITELAHSFMPDKAYST